VLAFWTTFLVMLLPETRRMPGVCVGGDGVPPVILTMPPKIWPTLLSMVESTTRSTPPTFMRPA